MYKTKGKEGSIELHISHIPMLKELFQDIGAGKLDMESDEVLSYYFDEYDKNNGKTCSSTFHQLMYLFENQV